MEIWSDLQLGAAYRRQEARLKVLSESFGKSNLDRAIQSKRAQGGMRLLTPADAVILHEGDFFTLDEMLRVYSSQLPSGLSVEQVKFRIYLSDVTEKEWPKLQNEFNSHPKKPTWNLSVQFTVASFKPKGNKKDEIVEIVKDIFGHLFEFNYIEKPHNACDDSNWLRYNEATIGMNAARDFLNRLGFDVQEIAPVFDGSLISEHSSLSKPSQLDLSEKVVGVSKLRRKKPKRREIIEGFITYIIKNTEYDTFPKFYDWMIEMYLQSNKNKLTNENKYNEHPQVQRVYITQFPSKEKKQLKNVRYNFHYSVLNNENFISQKPYSLISLKNIFDELRKRLRSRLQ